MNVGDRVRGLEGETGVVVEVGILMRDHLDRVRETVKVDVDQDPRFPHLGSILGAYRYVDTLEVIEE